MKLVITSLNTICLETLKLEKNVNINRIAYKLPPDFFFTFYFNHINAMQQLYCKRK